jgi:uncharacterized protein
VATPYATLEAKGGAPVELYRFVSGSTVFTLTSGDAPVSFNAGIAGIETYAPTELKRDGTSVTSEANKLSLDIGVAIGSALAQLFVGGVAPTSVTCTVYRFQRANLPGTLDPTYIVTPYFGTVAAALFQGSECRLTIVCPLWSIKQTVPAWTYQQLCNWALYSPGCSIIETAFTLSATISTIDVSGRVLGITFGAAAQAPPYYTAGILTFGNYKGYIEVHSDTISTLVTATLLLPVPGLIVGSSVSMAPGCDRTYPTCIAKFSNGKNHFGFPQLNPVDPWDKGITLASGNPGGA